MAWRIEFEPDAEKEFGKLASSVQRDITAYLEKLAQLDDPRQRGKPLRGDKFGLWRYRAGKHRVICKIEDKQLIILVLRVAKRDKLYD